MKIIHIGMAKTGTTYLQNAYFPKLAKANNLYYLNKFNNSDFIERRDGILLSNEFFTGGTGKYNHAIKIIEAIPKMIGSGYIPVVVFRQHSEWFFSLWKQHIQEGGTMKFTDYIAPSFKKNYMVKYYEFPVDIL